MATKSSTTKRRKTIKTSPPPEPQTNGVTEELIRERAYHLSLERNGGPADPVADWIRAERELTAERSASA